MSSSDALPVAEMRDAVLELVRRHGCVTLGALQRLLPLMTRSAIETDLARLWRSGAVRLYRLGSVRVWCAGQPRAVTVPCGAGVAVLDLLRLAEVLLWRLERRLLRGLYARPRDLLRETCACTARAPDRRGRQLGQTRLMLLARAALLAALDGAAGLSPRVRGGAVLVITDPARALEALRRVAETGALPLEPVPPPLPRGQPRGRGRRMALLSVHVPRKMLEALDGLVGRGAYRSRSEAVRDAIRGLLERYRMA
jgi:hypothetical protein